MKQINPKLNERQVNMLIAILDKEILDTNKTIALKNKMFSNFSSTVPNYIKEQELDSLDKYIDRLKGIKKALEVK